MKGGVASMVLAAETLAGLGIRLAGDLLVNTITDEESTGAGALAYLNEQHRLVREAASAMKAAGAEAAPPAAKKKAARRTKKAETEAAGSEAAAEAAPKRKKKAAAA